MTKFKKYEDYQKTNVDWINEIPNHWDMLPNRYFLKDLKSKVGNNSSQYTLLSLTKNGVIVRDLSEMKGKFPAEFNSYKIVNEGNLILCLFDIEETPRTVGLAKNKGMITGAYNVLEINNINPKFLTYFYIALDNTKELRSMYRGLRKTIKIGKFLSIKTPYPPIEEQNKIVDFIEYKEKQINKLIKKQKKLIELLEEKKKIIITEAVTKGLDKSVPMKDSGIDYIGQIPQHWEVRKLKFITTKKLQYGANESGIEYAENRPRYVRITDIDINKNILLDNDKLYLDEKIAKPYILKNGDILLARSGATVGKSYIYKEHYGKCAFAGYLIRAIVNKKLITPDYVYNYTLSTPYDLWKNKIFIQATIQNIGADKYSNLQVPIPSIDEQKNIVNYVNSVIEKFNYLIDKRVLLIKKLEEYKKTLISNTVTGQIDVRSYEIPATDDNIDLDEIENISKDDTETMSEVEYANN